jgi:hypothetical protein
MNKIRESVEAEKKATVVEIVDDGILNDQTLDD